MVWYYILGYFVTVYLIPGVCNSMAWIYQSISNRFRENSSDLNDSANSHDVTVDVNYIISPSRKQLNKDCRIPSYNRAFSCPAGPKTIEKKGRI